MKIQKQSKLRHLGIDVKIPIKQKNDINSIRKTARIRNKATGTYTEVLEFPISKSEVGKLELLPSTISEPNSLAKQLRDAGARLPKDDSKRKSLLVALAKSDAPDEFIFEAQTGWAKNDFFVLPNRVIGNNSLKVLGVRRPNSSLDKTGQLSVTGTAKSWAREVSGLARLSSILMCTACIALAAPLLSIMGTQSFTICLWGRTRAGKSIATLVASSALGIGRIEDLISWNSTDARLEQRLSDHNDCLFPIDDLMSMRGTDKERYQRLRTWAYRMTQGSATARHDSFTQAHGGIHESWRCISITSSEVSVRDLAEGVRMKRQEGETVRLIDLPVCGEGRDHIFDRLRARDDLHPDFQDWKSQTFAKIATACENHHGAVFDKYILALISRSKLKTYIRKRIRFFVKRVRDGFDGDVAQDVARKFGLIYAAGMLGVRANILRWEKHELLDAITKCYRAAKELLPDDGITLRNGSEALDSFLRTLPRLKHVSRQKTGKLDGYQKTTGGIHRYTVKCDAFNRIFTSVKQRELVLEFLKQKALITTTSIKSSTGRSAKKPQDQFVWADGKRRRSYEIEWPLANVASNSE